MGNGQMILLQFSKAAAFVGHTHYIIGVTAPALIVARLLGWKSLAASFHGRTFFSISTIISTPLLTKKDRR